MTQDEMMKKVRQQLSLELNCTLGDLCKDSEEIIFTELANHPKRRPFEHDDRHMELLTMGGPVVLSAPSGILDILRPQLLGKRREEVFCKPFVNGHSLYYLPALKHFPQLSPVDGYQFELIEQDRIPGLYSFPEFHNALMYDVNHLRPDVLVTLARKDEQIVGIAGASLDCADLWQIGIDVVEEARGQGLGAYLVNWLSHEILNRGYIPYYGTSSSNLASQRTAQNAGYFPAWMCAYHCLPDRIKEDT